MVQRHPVRGVPEAGDVREEKAWEEDVMTPRQRMIDAIAFRNPDRIPVVYHPSPAGLFVHGQKLLDLFRQYPPDNVVSFDSIPSPLPGTVDAAGRYHEIKKDEWGTTWEYLIFGVWGHPKAYPFADWSAARDFEFPPAPEVGTQAFRDACRWTAAQKQTHYLIGGGGSLLEKLCSLRPMDHVLMDLQDGDADLLDFLDRLVEHTGRSLEYALAIGNDAVMLGDDWGTQTAPIVSPEVFRAIYRPRYRALMDRVRRAGGTTFFHSCGCLGPLLNELFDLGIAGLWPQMKFYDSDEFAARCKDRGIAVYIHPDRQYLVPRGTPQEIRGAIRKFADRYHRLGGGGIFYIEIENDAPFENVKALIESVHTCR